VANKREKFGAKILSHYTDVATFVLRYFILTHTVVNVYFVCEIMLGEIWQLFSAPGGHMIIVIDDYRVKSVMAACT